MALEFLGGSVSPRCNGHPSSLGLQVLYNSAVGPLFAQVRDAAWQEEEEEHVDSNLRKVPIESRK